MNVEFLKSTRTQNPEPIHPFKSEVEAQLRHDRKLRIYFREISGGGYDLYVAKSPKRYLAKALPSNKVSISLMEKQRQASYINEPIIPIPNVKPTVEDVAKQVLRFFVPRFFPLAEGRPIDFYHINQRRTNEKPIIEIGFKGNSVVITHPNQVSAGIP